MLQWQPQQLQALKLLGYKRYLIRATMHEAAQYETPREAVPVIDWNALLEDKPAAEALPEAAIITQEFENEALYCDEHYSLLRHESLQFDWLFPPLAGFADDLRLLQAEDEALLLALLNASGWAEEALALSRLWRQVRIPQGHRPLSLSRHKKTVVLGAAPEEVAQEALLRLHHPAYIQQYPHLKRFWWAQCLAWHEECL